MEAGHVHTVRDGLVDHHRVGRRGAEHRVDGGHGVHRGGTQAGQRGLREDEVLARAVPGRRGHPLGGAGVGSPLHEPEQRRDGGLRIAEHAERDRVEACQVVRRRRHVQEIDVLGYGGALGVRVRHERLPAHQQHPVVRGEHGMHLRGRERQPSLPERVITVEDTGGVQRRTVHRRAQHLGQAGHGGHGPAPHGFVAHDDAEPPRHGGHEELGEAVEITADGGPGEP